MSYEDLPCVDFVELVTDYLEGALPIEQVLIIEHHLAFCAPCVDYLDQIRATMRATGIFVKRGSPTYLNMSA